MSRNGSGTYSLPSGNPVSSGTTISSTWANNTLSDIASALTQSLSKDGQTTWTGNQPAGGYKITGLGSGSAATDSATLAQVQAGAVTLLGGVGGTVDVITATTSPAIAAYVAGQTFRFVSAGANTGAVTINLNGLGAKSITKQGTTALAAGDIPSGAVAEITYDGTQFQLINVGSLTPILTSVTLGSGANQTALTATADTRVSSTTNLPTMTYRNTTADAGFITMNFAKTRAGLTTNNADIFARLTGSGVDTGNVARIAGYWDFRQTGAAGATFVTGQWLLSLTNTSGVDTTVIDATAARVNSAVPLQDSGARVFSRASGSMAESGELGIANNTLYTYAHGFAAVPKLMQAVLRCKTAEYGYAIGDEVDFASYVNSGSNVASAVWADATNIYARINSSAANNYSLARVSSNDSIGITYANWKIVLRAWY